MVVDSAVSAAGDPDAFFGEPLAGDFLPDAFPDFPAVLRFVCFSDDCAAEPGLALDFFADDLALPIT